MDLEGQVQYVSGPPICIHHDAGLDNYSTGPGGTVFIRDEDDRAKVVASYTRSMENAELIAIAFKVAKMAQEKGYDPIDALRGLPTLLNFVEKYEDFEFGVDDPEEFENVVDAAKSFINQIENDDHT